MWLGERPDDLKLTVPFVVLEHPERDEGVEEIPRAPWMQAESLAKLLGV